MFARIIRLLIATVLVGLGAVVSAPAARACACGAAPTRDDRPVTGETALVVLDGGTERIDMVMSLGGTTSDAGWIMPSPPGTELSLGDRGAIDRLGEATKPVPRKEYVWTPILGGMAGNSRGAPPPQSTAAKVERVTDVGPFRVTTLSGTHATGVNDWLRENGYATRDDLLPTFQGYLDQGWQIQAAKLVPGQGQQFQNVLPALRMTFPTNEPVYPIRLSRHAKVAQSVRLYIAADHRMDVARQASAADPLQLRYAGVLAPEVTGAARPLFVTAYQGYLPAPNITDDYTFTRASADDPFVSTYPVYDHTPGTIIGLVLAALILVAIIAAPIALVGGLVTYAVNQHRIRRGPRG